MNTATLGIWSESGECGVIPQVWRAASFWERMRGLLGRKPLVSGQGLWIEPCHSVHTIGMRYSIDVIYIDSSKSVVKVVTRLPPWNFSSALAASAVLELRAGESILCGIKPGVKLDFKND